MTFLKTLFASILGFFISIFLVFVTITLITIGIISSATEEQETTVASNSVLVIEPKGMIPEYSASQSLAEIMGDGSGITLGQYLARLEAASKDDHIKGIWLQLGSYSGDWAQAGELRAKLAEFKKSGRFIYATSDVNGWDEKNYYIASIADSVIMNPSARMEINGIYAALSFFKPMLDNLGVQAEIVRAGSFKSAVEPFILDSASPESRMMIDDIVKGSFAAFRAGVVESRKISEQQLDAILAGEPLLTATEAKAHGLIDAVMFHDQVLDLLRARTKTEGKDDAPMVELEDYKAPATEGKDGEIAVVYAVGGIGSGKSKYNPNPLFGGQMVGSSTFREAMKTAREDDDVKAVVLRIDSPGGDASASEEMWREIMLTREVKPVIASMAGVAASGGYYIAAAADTILAEPTTITGSIGVFGMWFNMEKLMEEKIGINTQVMTSNPYADMYSSVRPATAQERAFAEEQVDSTYRTFMTIVSQGRGLSMDSVMAIAQGRVWTGQQALALGLVDILGGFEKAVEVAAGRAGLKEGSYTLRILPQRKDFLDTFKETFTSQAFALFETRTVMDDYRALLDAMNYRSGIQARMPDMTLQ